MLGNIFDVFSRRKDSSYEMIPLSEAFRNRYLMLLKEFYQSMLGEVLFGLHKKFTFLLGKQNLSNSSYQISEQDDVINFLCSCEDKYLLDSIEYVFQVQHFSFEGKENNFINQINDFFKIDDLPYHVTNTIWEEVNSSLFGSPAIAKQIREFPKVIRKDNEVLHIFAIEPALTLLSKPDLLNANHEFLMALEDYKNGDYRDSVTKCCSALESTMKIICGRNKFAYSEKDTAAVLLKTIIEKTNLDQFWEQPIILIATIRNRLSYSHGAGSQVKNVPEHVAKYSINATASAILLICDEAY